MPAHQRAKQERQPADPATLSAALGVSIDADLLQLALTHRSYAYENGGVPHNERLEFLGDTVLGLAVTEYLYINNPKRPEGELAKIRASLVNMYTLADVARGLGDGGLGSYLLLGKGETITGGHDKHSILADTLEALIGAIYLDSGMEPARKVVLDLLGARLDEAPRLGAALDWKTSLQELCARLSKPAPRYSVTATGPDHAKVFTAEACVGERVLGTGEGRTKKEAEQHSAEQAWRALNSDSGKGAAANRS